jgi:AcrR family transcriptional regulator
MTYGSVVMEGAAAPTEDLAERRRRQIVEAAYEVFVERGYTNAGIADIAQRLGIGHGTFYRYFKNKRDILDHVFDYGVDRILGTVLDDVPPEAETLDEFREQLRTIGRRLFERLDSEPGLTQVVLLESTAIDEELTQRALGLIDTMGAMTARYLKNGVRRGFLRSDFDVELTARAVNAVVIPGLLAAVRGPVSPTERERYIDAAVGLVLDGTAA